MFACKRSPEEEKKWKEKKAKETEISKLEGKLEKAIENLTNVCEEDGYDEGIAKEISTVVKTLNNLYFKDKSSDESDDEIEQNEKKHAQNPTLERFFKLNAWFNELLLQNASLGADPSEKLNSVRDLTIDYTREAINNLNPALRSQLSCKITGKIMQEPVFVDGEYCERKALENLMKGTDTEEKVNLIVDEWLQDVIAQVTTIAETYATLQALTNGKLEQEKQNKQLEAQIELLTRRIIGLRFQNMEYGGNLHEEKLYDAFVEEKDNNAQGSLLQENEEVGKGKEKEKKKTDYADDAPEKKKGKKKTNYADDVPGKKKEKETKDRDDEAPGKKRNNNGRKDTATNSKGQNNRSGWTPSTFRDFQESAEALGDSKGSASSATTVFKSLLGFGRGNK